MHDIFPYPHLQDKMSNIMKIHFTLSSICDTCHTSFFAEENINAHTVFMFDILKLTLPLIFIEGIKNCMIICLTAY